MYDVGASEAIPRDPNLMYSNAFKQSDAESIEYRDYVTADLNQSDPRITPGGGGIVEGGFQELLGCGDDAMPYDLQFPAVKREMAAEQQGLTRYSFYEEDVGGVYGDTNPVREKMSGLARQSSSPAGFFSDLRADSVFSDTSGVGNFRAASGINGKSSPSGRLNDHITFSSRQSASSRFMPQIAENGNENTNPGNGNLGNGNGSNGFYLPSLEDDIWNDCSLSGLKRSREGEGKFSGFDAMDSQSMDDRYPNRLTHHLSLPKTSGEMAAIEKYLQFQQDAVPCKIRAKRGCATHPRSIAERKRRTRISDRMKKLQDLFPNMDKQTNTADMLDLAVEYIKDLQNQVQILTGKKAKCTCSK